MTNGLSRLLNKKGFLLADGATGTNLFNIGLQSSDAPELWNETHPQNILRLHQGAVDAVSDIFLTNSFGGNSARLKLHNAGHWAHGLSRISAELGRSVADKADRTVIVAGSVGPTGELMAPLGPLTHSVAVEIFYEQAEGLKEGGADVMWLETISAPEEFRAAAEGFALAGVAWCGTMSFDTAGRTMMGLTSEAMVSMVVELPNLPLGFGANCGTGASDLLRTVLDFAAQGSALPIIAKGNAGIPKYVDGHIHYDGTPELMADYAVMARDCGATIIGGCCGTMPKHLSKMRIALDERAKSLPPALDDIAARIRPFSSASDGTAATAAAPTNSAHEQIQVAPTIS